ncbi:nucleotidyltransferase domain-containing protein [Candidatus Pacearchaeota archaeon]|nr:nucleotidyltransferase domain-containing protein [Candidatus Pacearchaeota archaeon]
MILNTKKLKILEEFSTDYNKRIYGRNVAQKLKVNQKTVSNTLNELERENILKFTQEGKNKYYYLNKFYPYIRETIQLIETQRKINFLEEHNKLKELFLELEKRIKGILIIFGSYANFSSNEKSDLDLFVIGEIKDTEDLEELYNIKINIVKSNKNKFNKEDYIIKEIIKNHIVLKGAEDFIKLIW